MDLEKIAGTFTSFAKSGTSFVYILALAIGILFVFLGVVGIIKKGSRAAHERDSGDSWGGIISRLLIGALITTLGWTLSQILGTVGDSGEARSALAYVQSTGSNPVAAALWAMVKAWVVFIGTIGFLRGFLILERSSHGGRDSGDDVWRAIWHIVGGAIVIQVFS